MVKSASLNSTVPYSPPGLETFIVPESEILKKFGLDVALQEGVCARVKLQLNQSAVITRSAFRATLEINNGSPSNLENVQVTFDIRDADKQSANAKFGIRPPVLTALSAVDGTGVVDTNTTGKAEWTIIPTRDAAPNGEAQYFVGGTLSYKQDGAQVTVPLYPTPIQVLPDPSLQFKYFWQRDVYSDDPFTDAIEPAEPFDLGLMITNVGKGTAKDVTITSAQPKIIENEKGLLIDFKLLNTQVGSQKVSNSLTAKLGSIAPAQTAVARWQLSASLQGKFIDYKASYKHVDDLNDPRLSLIDSLAIHELNHTVRADAPSDDQVPDFLANDEADEKGLPDTLHKSDGTTAPVSAVTNATIDGAAVPGHLQVALSANLPTGWAYLEIPDPANAAYKLVSVRRSDGKELLLDWNAWITSRTKRPKGGAAYQENLFHLLDFNSSGHYLLTYLDTRLSPTSGALISEFRLSGPGGTSDEFIEIYNQGNSALDLSGWSVVSAGVTVSIPGGKTIPPYGRLLLTNSTATTGYSLANYGGMGAATGDVTYSGDIAFGATLTLRNALGGAVDVVSSGGLPSPLAMSDNYSYVRRMDGAGGAPLDTDNDATDFNLVDVQSTLGPNNTTGVSNNLLRLGAPGPQNLSNPISANQLITFTPATPNMVRTGSGNSGTLALRNIVTNRVGSGRTITALRFRVVGLTAGTTAAGNTTPADIRLVSSTVSGSSILPLLLQNPPTQPNGGGLNCSVSLAALPGGGLTQGQSVTVELLFNVFQKGTYRFLLNAEPVATAAPN